MTLLLGTVELMRRAMWALFRLEWEQILRVARQEDQLDRVLAEDSMAAISLDVSSQPGESVKGAEPNYGGAAGPSASLRQPLLPSGALTDERSPDGRSPSRRSKDERIASALKGNVRRMGRWSYEKDVLEQEEP